MRERNFDFDRNSSAGGTQSGGSIYFNTCKDEEFDVKDSLKELKRRLQSDFTIREPQRMSRENIDENELRSSKLFITCGPRKMFTSTEFSLLKHHIESGNAVLIMIGEGGEQKYQTNINYFLEDFGISVNSDSVVRLEYYKYHHPKEALITNGVLNRGISEAAGKSFTILSREDEGNNSQAITFVYPFGATLNVKNMTKELHSVPVLSTGSVCFPINRPVMAFYEDPTSGGRLAVMGSTRMFNKEYINKEENWKIGEVLFKWLMKGPEDVHLNKIDSGDPEVGDYMLIPDTTTLSENVKASLQETEEVNKDEETLFEDTLFEFDTSLVPLVIDAYKDLKVDHEPLTLIPPEFETPLPHCQPAVFPPTFREVEPPALELFNLDEEFSSSKSRLATAYNKCTEDDLQYFIEESGDICGILDKIGSSSGENRSKKILEFMFKQIVAFKKTGSTGNDDSMIQQGSNNLTLD